MLPGMSNPFSQFSDPRFPPGVDSHLQPPPWQVRIQIKHFDRLLVLSFILPS